MYRSTIYFGRSGAAIQAMAGVDIALWDIKGQALGQPIATLLGGAQRNTMRVYSSNMFQFTVEATGRTGVAGNRHWPNRRKVRLGAAWPRRRD